MENVTFSVKVAKTSKMATNTSNTGGRGPKYSEKLETLIINIQQSYRLLFGSFTGVTIMNQMKERKWDEIYTKVNAHNVAPRMVKQLKNKWSNFCSHTKMKAAKLKRETPQTGNKKLKKSMCLSPLEQTVIETIGEVAVSGVKAGIDNMLSDNDEGGEHEAEEAGDTQKDLPAYSFQAISHNPCEIEDIRHEISVVDAAKKTPNSKQVPESNGDQLVQIEKMKLKKNGRRSHLVKETSAG